MDSSFVLSLALNSLRHILMFLKNMNSLYVKDVIKVKVANTLF